MKNGASVQECQSNATEYVVQKPCMGSNVMVELSKDEPTAFNFAVEDIRAMKLLADGAMLISFNDGSTLTVTNFKAARESFPFTDIAMSDGTVMNLQKVAMGLAGTAPQDTVADLTILKPQGGLGATDLAFNLQEGKTYTLGFDLKDVAAMEQRDGDLVITFKDGSHLTLQNYELVANGVLPPQMTLADGSVIPAVHLINVLNVAAAEQVKTVEPAAGDVAVKQEVAVKKVEVAAKEIPAEQLAQIEPAAGGAAGPIGGTSGYGFNSSVDPAGILGIGALGPIGPTALSFGLPELLDTQVAALNIPAAPVPFGPPTLSAIDKFTFEDTAVNLQIAANGTNPANETLTLTITGIPAGWTVDIAASGGGTYTPGNVPGTLGTYTRTYAQGQGINGGPILIPPANKDGDIKLPSFPPLNISVTSVEAGTNNTFTSTATMNVTVDAVADQPDLAVQNVSGSDNLPLALQIQAAVTDTDGSEVLTTATLTGIPAGFTLNHGTFAAGVWTVNASDLPTLTLTPPRGYDGSFVVTVRVNNIEQNLTDDEITLSNNTNFNTESFLVTFNDTTPIIGDSIATVDDTSLAGGNNVATGTISMNYQLDTPGVFAPTNTFTAGGSLAGGTLKSNGNPVTVALNGNTYTGTANGVTVFTLVVNANGAYTFTQFEQLDHGDINATNEAITLNFTVQGTDFDGDTDTGIITINVLDDAPVAANDTIATGTTVAGNVTSNDSFSQDTPNTVTQVTVNGVTTAIPANGTNATITGAFGTLVINNTGAYTYTSRNVGAGTDNFQYTLRDFDGDISTATLSASISGIDTVPVIGNDVKTIDETALATGANIVSGTVPSDFLTNIPGTINATSFSSSGSQLGGTLTSNGNAVTVALAGNTWTGTANGVTVFTLVLNTNGQYTFTQFEQLDHADGANPNDSIALQFTVTGTDVDGDTDTGTITINVLDDAPIANNDNFVSATGTASGNIMTNDVVGQDVPGRVFDVTFGGQTVALNANGTNSTITNASGTLVINSTGAFTFTPPVPGSGVTFTYRLIDFDNDLSVVDAQHGTVVIDTGGVPTITGGTVTVDETNLTAGAQVANGTYTFSYGGDGQGATGTIATTGYTGPALTSHGVGVTLTQAGNTFTGTANGVTVFTMVINTNGTYTFTQFDQLDHPNANDPNDALNLTFGIRITDADGSAANGTLTAVVLDDGPIAINDSFLSSGSTASGNITTNDVIGQDTPGRVFDVTFGGQTVVLDPNGTNATITNASGTLIINTTGQFTYTPPLPGNGATFTYRLVDFDGDKSVVDATHGTVTVDTDGTPIIGDSIIVTDETSLVSGPTVTTGTVSSEYFGDGPGSITPVAGFTSGGSLLNGALTSHGQPVTVTLVGNTFTGTANGVTVFTLAVNTNGQYTFTQFEQLDHANGSDPNDIITLNFNVRGTDADGDIDNGTITVNIRDDAPSALNDTVNMPNGTNTASGNVLTNDTPGQDTPVPVLSVTYNGVTTTLPANGTNATIVGAHGTLVINNTGAYTYTATNTSTGTDAFQYTIRDYDNDTSSATLSISVADLDTVPVVNNSAVSIDETNLNTGPITVTGAVAANYFSDGPGTITAQNIFQAGGSLSGGTLKSGGNPVTVTLSGNTYTGTANGVTVFTLTVAANGSYSFTQFEQLDHADATNPNDIITLNFTVLGTDADGDTDTGIITVNVADDAPIAVNDSFLSSTTTATGNILTNDTIGQDVPGRVYDVTFGGQTVVLNANGTNSTITNAAGTLVINSTGAFTYTPPLPGNGTTFTYRVVDADGDLSVANAQNGTVVVDTDGTPVITSGTTTVYEVGSHTSTGTITGNFFGDGPGTFITCGGFTPGGSLLNGALTAGGHAVTVTNTGNGYIGTANGQTVFSLTVAANGSYTFNLFKALDHGNPTNPNDIINLGFQVCGVDADGDVSHAILTVNVVDGAPVANTDNIIYCTTDYFHNGNLVTGFNPGTGSAGVDSLGWDTPVSVYAVSSGAGGTQQISGNGVTQIDGQFGKLYVFSNGAYVYYATTNGDHVDTFTYYLKDFDGDTSAGTLALTAQSNNTANSSVIILNGGTTNGTAGHNAFVSYAANVADTVNAGDGDDVIMSWSGNDQLHGGAGNDVLIGEYGADQLWGDSGADVFVADYYDHYGAAQGKFYDTVHDFNAAQGDVIDLSALIDNGSAAQAAINNYVRAVNTGADTMIQVNTGTGWNDAMLIANHNNLDVQALLNNGNLDV